VSGRPGRLSRELVVKAALELIDTEGLGALSMRRVGQALDVEAMSLYRYVTSREALLDAVVESIMDELWADPEVQFQPEDGWQDCLTRLAHAVRRHAVAHPRAFPLVATRPPEAPFVRPPLRSQRWLDAFLTALRSRGFTDEGALYAYRAYTSFLLGHLLLEVAHSAEDPAVTDAPLHDAVAVKDPGLPIEAAAHVDAADHPLVAEFATRPAEDHAEQEFTGGLYDLLARLAAHPGAGPTT